MGDGARVEQPLHDGGTALRGVGEFRTRGRGGDLREVDVVLDGEGDTKSGKDDGSALALAGQDRVRFRNQLGDG